MKKTATKPTAASLKKIQQKEDRAQLQEILFARTEEKIENRFSDARLDREHEKITLLSGAEISLFEIRQIRETIAKQLQTYEPTYPPQFYEEIFRLKGWPIPVGGITEKPHVIAQYTNEIIYQRFSKEVLPMLQHLNPCSAMGFRMHKHFQWLTPEARVHLVRFIDEAIAVMRTCTNWYEFRIKYATQYGLSFQLKMKMV